MDERFSTMSSRAEGRGKQSLEGRTIRAWDRPDVAEPKTSHAHLDGGTDNAQAVQPKMIRIKRAKGSFMNLSGRRQKIVVVK
jgi:hypothetical protein